MTASYPLVRFGLDDTNLKDKISSITDSYGVVPKFSSCNLNDLGAMGNITIKPYATFEPDFWVLDGNYHLMPASPKIGFMGSALSNGSGVLTSTSVVSFFFSPVQDFTSITLHFGESDNQWCNNVVVDFRDAGGASLYSVTIYPTSTKYTVTHTVTGCDHLNITLAGTNLAYRFPRLTAIDFNVVTWLDSTKIKSAKILEEVSPISSTLTVNTFDLDLLLDNADFSITNPSSPYALPEKMPFMVWEVLNNETNFMGQFYLEHWDNQVSRVVSFHCIDAMGILEKVPWYGWVGTAGVGVSIVKTILDFLFSQAGMSYTCPADLSTFNIYGYITPSSTRDALQQIAMMCRLTVNCARSYKVKITHTTLAFDLYVWDYIVGLNNEKIDSVKLLPLVDCTKTGFTGIDPTPGGFIQVYDNSNIPLGKNVIALSSNQNPITTIFRHDISSPSAIITELTPANWNDVGAYFYLANVTLSGDLGVGSNDSLGHSGEMIPGQPSFFYYNPLSTQQKIVEIAYNILCDGGSGSPYLQHGSFGSWIFKYFAQRYIQKTRIYNSLIGAGNSVYLTSYNDQYLSAVVEKAEIELVGLRTDIEAIGIIYPSTYSYFVEYDDTDLTFFSYTGGHWEAWTGSGPYNNTLHDIPNGFGGSVNFNFSGSRFKFIYTAKNDRGSVYIYIDGVLVATLNQYSVTPIFQSVWDSGILNSGSHSVTITKVGTSNVVDIDAVEVF